MERAIVKLKKGEGRTLKSGGAWVFDNEISDMPFLEKVYSLCFGFLIKLGPSQIFLTFEPHIIAFSIIFLVRRYFNLSKDNLQILKNIFNLQFKSFRDCAQFIKK